MLRVKPMAQRFSSLFPIEKKCSAYTTGVFISFILFQATDPKQAICSLGIFSIQEPPHMEIREKLKFFREFHKQMTSLRTFFIPSTVMPPTWYNACLSAPRSVNFLWVKAIPVRTFGFQSCGASESWIMQCTNHPFSNGGLVNACKNPLASYLSACGFLGYFCATLEHTF